MSLRRTHAAALALALAAPFTLAACGTGPNSPTYAQYQAGIGANLRTGPIQLYNALFVDNENGTYSFSASGLAGEGKTQTITAVDAVMLTGENDEDLAGSTPVDVALVGDPIEVNSMTSTIIGTEPQIVATSDSIAAGDYITLRMTTESGEKVSISVPVVTRTQMYKSVGTAPAPAADPGRTEPTPTTTTE